MATVNDIMKFMDALAPRYMAESWDNVGLLCGRSDRSVHRILVSLDPFETVIDRAIELGADLLVTHHPLIFGDPLTAVNDSTQTGRCLLKLVEQGIAAINAHTNWDLAPGGVNDVLAETLGLQQVQVLAPEGTDAEGRPYGLLRAGSVPEQTGAQFLAHVKQTLGCQGLRYAGGTGTVRKVAVGGGSCGGAWTVAKEHGCDALVTADVKYNQFRSAWEAGILLIDAGHFHTENPSMPLLARKLAAAFPETQVVFDETHTDVMKFF